MFPEPAGVCPGVPPAVRDVVGAQPHCLLGRYWTLKLVLAHGEAPASFSAIGKGHLVLLCCLGKASKIHARYKLVDFSLKWVGGVPLVH